MREQSDISETDFVTACRTVATVLAGNWWLHGSVKPRPTTRLMAPVSAAMDCQTAAKYCGFGRTRFRQLVAAGVFPPPVTIEGRNRWLAKDLEASLARFRKERRSRK